MTLMKNEYPLNEETDKKERGIDKSERTVKTEMTSLNMGEKGQKGKDKDM